MTDREDKNFIEISDDDIREAFKDIKSYLDITLEDFKEIYRHALNHAIDRIHNAVVEKVMTKDVVAISEDMDVRAATEFLIEKGLTCAPVVDDKNIVKGFLSDADILTAAGVVKEHTFKNILRHLAGEPVPHYHNPVDVKKVKDIMTSPAIAVTAETGIKKAAEIIIEKRIKRLPVVDQDKKLVGIVSLKDIAKKMGGR